MQHVLAVQDQQDLDTVLGNLQFARQAGDLGRMAHLAYWDVRRWARRAHHGPLAEQASNLIIGQPHPSRSAFLALVDEVISELEKIRRSGH